MESWNEGHRSTDIMYIAPQVDPFMSIDGIHDIDSQSSVASYYLSTKAFI